MGLLQEHYNLKVNLARKWQFFCKENYSKKVNLANIKQVFCKEIYSKKSIWRENNTSHLQEKQQ